MYSVSAVDPDGGSRGSGRPKGVRSDVGRTARQPRALDGHSSRRQPDASGRRGKRPVRASSGGVTGQPDRRGPRRRWGRPDLPGRPWLVRPPARTPAAVPPASHSRRCRRRGAPRRGFCRARGYRPGTDVTDFERSSGKCPPVDQPSRPRSWRAASQRLAGKRQIRRGRRRGRRLSRALRHGQEWRRPAERGHPAWPGSCRRPSCAIPSSGSSAGFAQSAQRPRSRPMTWCASSAVTSTRPAELLRSAG